MAESPNLETERLHILPFGESFLSKRYVSWLNDPEIVRYSEQRFHTHTTESCRQYWRSFQGTDNYFWAVVAKESALGHIGTMTAYVDKRHGVADIGILFGERQAQGKGLALEAWMRVSDFLFAGIAMRKLTAGTMEVNTPMLRLAQRAGMVPDGRRVRHMLWNGREVDILYFARFCA